MEEEKERETLSKNFKPEEEKRTRKSPEIKPKSQSKTVKNISKIY